MTDVRRAYFNGLAERWDQIPAPPDACQRIERFLDAVVEPGDERVLDAGCGTGILVPGLRARLPGACLVEFDFAERMLGAGRLKWADPGLRWVCGDAACPPFAEGAFDLVLCFNVLPHWQDREGALAGVLGRLRAGGRLAVGHVMGSAEVTALHSQIGGPVGADALPPAAELSQVLSSLGARVLRAEESPAHYLVVAARKL